MIIEYSIQDVLDLSHTVCRNFYPEQKDRFEIHKESKRVLSDGHATMMFFETRLEALLAFKVLNQPYHAAMVWDLNYEEWGVVCSMTWEQYKKITE